MNNSIVDFLNSKGQASDYNSRAILAKNNGITNYTGTADQNLTLLNSIRAKGTSENPMPPAPPKTVNGAISVDQLEKATPIQTVTPPVYDPTNDKNTIGSIAGYLANNFKLADEKKKSIQTEQDAVGARQLELMKLIGDKAGDTQTAENSLGVNAELDRYTNLTTRLAELDAEASALDREAKAIPIQAQIDAEGKGISDGGLAPITAAQLRNNAIKALTIAQEADITVAAATGSYNKIQLAREKAAQIVDLKYKPLEQELELRKKQYELNKDVLSGIDKERTEALGVALELEQTAMASKKADDKLKSDIITKASPYAPQDLLIAAKNAPDSTTAAIILGKYAQDYLQQEKLKQEVIKLQIENGTYNPVTNVSESTIVNKDNGFGLQDYKRGIQAVESAGSGGYSALGPVITNGGMYSGDRAYGKYQVMGKNIPSWTKEALGYSMTPEQFRASPDAQEKVFDHFAEKEYAKYGNWGDVASVWFSGKPLSGNTATDGGNTVPQYVQKVFKNMGVTNKPATVAIPGVTPQIMNNLNAGRIQPGQVVDPATGTAPKSVSAAIIDDYATLRDLVNKTKEYEKLYKEVANEGVTGVFGTGLVKGTKNAFIPSEKATRLDSIRDEFVDLIARFRTGAALTKEEQEFYKERLPGLFAADQLFGNPDVQIATMIDNLSDTLDSKMTANGVVFAPSALDIYYARMGGALNPVSGSSGSDANTYYGYNF